MKIFKLTVFLAIIAGLSAGALSYVYGMTNPVIVAQKAAEEKKQLQAMYNDGETFTKYTEGLSKYNLIESCYKAELNGETKGFVYKISTPGYGGDIVYLIALDASGVYKSYQVIDVSTETSGFGSRVATDEMKNNIVNKKIEDQVDTLSGATISSTAVVKGISQATAHYKAYFK